MNVQRRINHFIEIQGELGGIAIISDEFRDRVLTHIIGNYCPQINAPLFLAVHGSPGEGKTFQTFRICAEHNVKICYFSGSELSGNYEKDSILDFEENYKRASNFYDDHEYSVIIVDDFHLSPASTKEGVGTTINSQLLTGYLMNLCDKAQNGQCLHIPIILLGNTFKNVYDPLKRDGRMDFFHWEAPLEIKRKVAIELLSPYMDKFDRNKLDAFVIENKEMSVSFFAEIKKDIEKQTIRKFIHEKGIIDIKHYINTFGDIKTKSLTISQLKELATNRKNASSASNEGDEWTL